MNWSMKCEGGEIELVVEYNCEHAGHLHGWLCKKKEHYRPLTCAEVEEKLRHSSMYELREPKIQSMINLMKKGKKFTYKGSPVTLRAKGGE